MASTNYADLPSVAPPRAGASSPYGTPTLYGYPGSTSPQTPPNIITPDLIPGGTGGPGVVDNPPGINPPGRTPPGAPGPGGVVSGGNPYAPLPTGWQPLGPGPSTPDAPPLPGASPIPQAGPAPGQQLQDLYNTYATGVLQNPNPWNSGMVQSALGDIQNFLGEQRRQAVNSLNEQMAARGLTGSSVAAEQRGLLESNLNNQAQQYADQLQQEIANAEAQGRAAASGVAGSALGSALDRYSTQAGLGLQGAGLGIQQQANLAGQGLQQYQQESQNAINQRAQELQAAGMDRQAALQQAQLEQNANAQRIQELSVLLQSIGQGGLSPGQLQQYGITPIGMGGSLYGQPLPTFSNLGGNG